METGYGRFGKADQNNLFNLRHPGNTDPARVAPWQGAIACNALAGVTDPGFACFDADRAFYNGAHDAALQVHKNWTSPSGYSGAVTAAGIATHLRAQYAGTTDGDVAQALADAGYCPESKCQNGGYKNSFDTIYKSVRRRAACFNLE